MNEKLNRIHAEVSLTEAKLDEVEKLIKKYEIEKQQLENKLDELCNEEEMTRGEIFANECIEGKHPIVDWNDLPKYMKMHLHKMFQESLGTKHLNESSQQIVIDNAIAQFKKFYHIEHFEVLKTAEEINNKLFEQAQLT